MIQGLKEAKVCGFEEADDTDCGRKHISSAANSISFAHFFYKYLLQTSFVQFFWKSFFCWKKHKLRWQRPSSAWLELRGNWGCSWQAFQLSHISSADSKARCRLIVQIFLVFDQPAKQSNIKVFGKNYWNCPFLCTHFCRGRKCTEADL